MVMNVNTIAVGKASNDQKARASNLASSYYMPDKSRGVVSPMVRSINSTDGEFAAEVKI